MSAFSCCVGVKARSATQQSEDAARVAQPAARASSSSPEGKSEDQGVAVAPANKVGADESASRDGTLSSYHDAFSDVESQSLLIRSRVEAYYAKGVDAREVLPVLDDLAAVPEKPETPHEEDAPDNIPTVSSPVADDLAAVPEKAETPHEEDAPDNIPTVSSPVADGLDAVPEASMSRHENKRIVHRPREPAGPSKAKGPASTSTMGTTSKEKVDHVQPTPKPPSTPIDPFRERLPGRRKGVVDSLYKNPGQASPMLDPRQRDCFLPFLPRGTAAAATPGHQVGAASSPVVFLISRSKNLNTVVYRVKEHWERIWGKAGEEPMQVHWEDFAVVQPDGSHPPRSELNWMDRKAYSIKSQTYRKATDSYLIRLTALPDAEVELVRPRKGSKYSRPVGMMRIGGVPCVLFHIYAQAKEGGWLPLPIYVNAHGWDETGREVVEEMLKKK
eukprot:g11632.t1